MENTPLTQNENLNAQGTQTVDPKTVAYPYLDKLAKSKKTIGIVLLAVLAVFLITLSIYVFSNLSPKEKEAEVFSPATAQQGQYVKLDIIDILTLSAKEDSVVTYNDKEKTDIKDKTVVGVTNYCLATDSNHNVILVAVPEDYYNITLKSVEDGNANAPVSVVGHVSTIPDDVDEHFTEELSELSEYIGVAKQNGYIDILERPEYEKSNASALAIAFLLLPVLVVLLIIRSSKKKKYNKANKCYTDYGNIDIVYQNILNNTVYKDDKITVSQDYIVSNSDKFTLTSTKDALCIYQYIHKTNGVTDDISIMVVNKYGEKIKFTYGAKYKDKIPEILLTLKILCPNAKLGYDADSQQYVEKNKVSRYVG